MREIPHATHHALPRARHLDPAKLFAPRQERLVERLGGREVFRAPTREDGMGDDFVYVFPASDEFRVLLFLRGRGRGRGGDEAFFFCFAGAVQ
jgi:hypothetical protein